MRINFIAVNSDVRIFFASCSSINSSVNSSEYADLCKFCIKITVHIYSHNINRNNKIPPLLIDMSCLSFRDYRATLRFPILIQDG